MTRQSFSPHSLAIATHPTMEGAGELAADMAAHISRRGLNVAHASLYDEELRARVASGEFEILAALGGDGTMLRAGHLCAPFDVPILGINLGRLGFLMDVKRDEWRAAIDRVLEADYWLEPRMMLRAEQVRDAETLGGWDVLNECVVGRGGIVRPVNLTAEIDDRPLTTYVADALIVSTATGSTAYALAAGGPILPPQLRNILLVPVAPHLSVDRAIVLDEGSRVRVTVRTDHQASMSIDGQPPMELKDGDQVDVRAGKHTTLFVRLQDPSYFYRNLTSGMHRRPPPGVQG
ncbi:MAG TPA: NAD(+)/NADH kinase [Anaerolineales bacterium]|nr:NAD(+)/NADH kinase [Anaerolineales bacterium]